MNIKLLDKYKNKKVLIVGLGSAAFSYISVFKELHCSIKITDIRHIFDLNKSSKLLYTAKIDKIIMQHYLESLL